MRQWKLALLLGAMLGACSVFLLHDSYGAGQSQAEMNQQAGQEYQKADADLNKAYRKLIGSLDAGPKARLKTAQSAWIKFRDTEADFRASKAQGGTIYPMVHANYLTELTKRRTQELQDDYKLYHTPGQF